MIAPPRHAYSWAVPEIRARAQRPLIRDDASARGWVEQG
jgi:hypothetical protein